MIIDLSKQYNEDQYFKFFLKCPVDNIFSNDYSFGYTDGYFSFYLKCPKCNISFEMDAEGFIEITYLINVFDGVFLVANSSGIHIEYLSSNSTIIKSNSPIINLVEFKSLTEKYSIIS